MNQTQLLGAHDGHLLDIDIAGNTLERQDAYDNELGSLELTVGQHGMPTSSGLNDYDYQNISTLSLNHKQLNQLQTVNKIPIPTEILEHFKHVKCHCRMGLFPEIGRAWFTIDSEIYIWTYEHTRDVAYYDGLNHVIVSVGLIKPRDNVFMKHVKYLLILTTPIEIVVLGVTFGDTTKTISSPIRHNRQNTAIFEEMQLLNKPIFVMSTDNVSITTVQGTDDGRIFLGGRDGCLYEITYQAESSWFGKRCRKINHSKSYASYVMPNIFKLFSEPDPILRIVADNSRGLLYTLSEKGTIEAWCLRDGMRHVGKMTESEVIKRASAIIPTVDNSVFKTIKSICPLSVSDSERVHLIAVSHSGVRFFFNLFSTQIQQQQQTFQQQQSLMQTQGQVAPPSATLNTSFTGVQQQPNPMSATAAPPTAFIFNGINLLHVRLPPGYTPNTTTNKPKSVHTAYFTEGTLLLVSNPQQDQDFVWSVSCTPFPNRQCLTEATTILPLDGVVWSIAEVRERCKAKLRSVVRASQKPKRVCLLTNQGAHFVSVLQPADLLKQLLAACHGAHHDAIRGFFQTLTEREACVTCLLIICSEQNQGSDIAMWAAQAFMLYGGEALYKSQLINAAAGMRHLGFDRNQPQMAMSTPMHSMSRAMPLSHLGSPAASPMQSNAPYPISPIANQNSMSPGGGMNDPSTLVLSAKHDSLYVYMARLLRPIWRSRCVNRDMKSTFSQDDLALVLEDLYAFKAFLDGSFIHEFSYMSRTLNNQTLLSNGYNTMMSNTNVLSTNEQRNLSDQAQIEEKRSILALNTLLKQTCEVIALWKILSEHDFSMLLSRLTNEQKFILSSCTFRDLILTRKDLNSILIIALINSYLNDNASVSSISAKLREVCPDLYRHEDAISYKATEILMSSKNTADTEEKSEKLSTALQLCKDAAPTLPLQNICQQFTLAGYYQGVVELTATCAAKTDVDELGIHYYNSEEPTEDREGYNYYALRVNCYREVRLMLDYIYQNICSSNTNKDFAQSISMDSNKNHTDANSQIMNIVSLAMQIKDPILHNVIYEWLMTHDLLSELLSLAEPSLGEFLRRNVIRNPDNIKLIDLLWKYYEKNGQHAQAAHILDKLASTQSESIKLEQRIEYLARAVMCMRNESVGYSISNGILLKELEDKLEIARVQKSVHDAVSALAATNPNVGRTIAQLNSALYDITQLYQDFAEPYNLWECKLVILNCSHHNDPLLIESVWSNIISKIVEGPGSVQERSNCLFTKIESLAKDFGESGHCFPLAFLIRELEVKACQMRLTEGIVPEKLVNMNLDVELLMEYYSRMIAMGERVWANEGNEWHLVQSVIRLVSILTRNPHSIWNRSKRRVVGKAQDIISECLSLCYQKPGTEYLQQSLKELQCRLQRVLA